MRRFFSFGRREAGFSLVELMVAVLIGLIGTLVIFQVFSVSEGTKRTTTGGGDAQQNGSIGLFTIERDVRMAGYGLNVLALLGCTVHAYDEGSGAPREFNFILAPVVINQPANQVPPGPANGPDQISLMFGSSDLLAAPAKLTQAMPSPAATYKVDNRYGFREGDLIIAAEPGLDCTLAQATNLPGTPGQSDNVIHGSGQYTDPKTGQNVAARYNKPGGLGISYGTSGKLYNLGPAPSKNTYSVVANRLTLQNEISAAVDTPIIDGIVQLQAEYGKDTNGNGVIDIGEWSTVTPAAGSPDWRRILAARMAIVARSTTPERPNPNTGTCDITAADSPSLAYFGGFVDVSMTAADWQCYRYKVFQTVVPLRNLLWKLE